MYDTTDTFKAIIHAGWNVKSDGDVESPTGYFALIEIPENDAEKAEIWEAIEADKMGLPKPADGWYFVTINSDGIARAEGGSGYYHIDARKTSSMYDQAEEQYHEWLNADEKDV